MFERVPSYFEHQDDRGKLVGIINEGDWKESNYITSIKGTVRGNHYHKETTELFFIITGEIKVSLECVSDRSNKQEFIAKAGDIFKILPGSLHTFEVIEDSAWINFLDCKINQSAPDIHRL